MEKFQIFHTGVASIPLPTYISYFWLDNTLSWTDGIIPALILALCLTLGALEWRQKQLTILLRQCLSTEGRTLTLLLLAGLVLVRYYFARGQLSWSGDAAPHTAYAALTALNFADGQFPIWTYAYANGTPFLQFYGFLFFYLTGLVDLLFGDIFTSLKLVLGLCHLASGLSAYGFARLLYRSRSAGLLAGLAYILSFWHLQQVLIMGRLPLGLFYALLPLPFFFFERYRLADRRLTSLVGGSICLALLTFTHPGYAFWATIFFGLYCVLRLKGLKGKHRRQHTWGALGILAGGLALGAYLTLPMWLERHATGLAAGLSLAHVPDPTWNHLLSWSNYRARLLPMPEDAKHWYGGYIGLSLVGIALWSLWHCRSPKSWRPPLLALGLCLLLALTLVFAYRLPVLQALAPVTALSAGRYLLFVVFFLALVAGAAAARNKGYPLLLLLLLADLAPTTFQHPYLSRQKALVDLSNDELEHLSAGTKSSRVTIATASANPLKARSWLTFKSSAATVHPLYDEAPLAAKHFVRQWHQAIDPALHAIALGAKADQDILKKLLGNGMKLLNSSHLVITSPDRSNIVEPKPTPASPLVASAKLTPYPTAESIALETPKAAVAWAREHFPNSPHLAQTPRLIPPLWIIANMDLQHQGNTCETIFIRDLPQTQQLAAPPQINLLSHQVDNQRVHLQVHTLTPCFARLAYAHYPFQRVLLNGQPTQVYQTAGYFTALHLPAGTNDIVLEPYLSPLRRTLLLTNVFLLAAAAFLLVHQRRKRRLD